jgi:hypothetical protein
LAKLWFFWEIHPRKAGPEKSKTGFLDSRIPGFLISSVLGVLRVVSSGVLGFYEEPRKPGVPKAVEASLKR